MILRNWYRALTMTISGKYAQVVNVLGAKIDAGNSLTSSPNVAYCLSVGTNTGVAPYIGLLRAGYNQFGGIVLGNGNAPVSFDDYKLSGDVLTTISAPSATPTITIDDSGFTAKVTHTVTNTGTEEITISEIGLMAKSQNDSYDSYGYLLERTVLDNPIKIPAGGVGQVTYTFRLNCPTA